MTTSSKYTLYIGLNDKDSKVQKIDTIEAYKIVENVCCTLSDGATIYQARGVYKHVDSTVIVENTLCAELFTDNVDTVKTIATVLKQALNQESILIQKDVVENLFL